MDRPDRIGRYRLEREVARGGTGVVHRATAPDGRLVALKLLPRADARNPLQRRRAGDEVQALLRLRHPHVVQLLDAGEHEGTPWLAMEWVEGETLAARLEREGPLPPTAAARLVGTLAGALAHCHAQGVLHRDLKPANVLLRAADGVPLLVDFGLSKDLGGQVRTLETATGCWLGTPGFWSPEQARGQLQAVGPRSDVYGLGALLYAALTGAAPQAGESLPELLAALERPPEPPSALRPGVPAWLDAVCLQALATDPAARPESAQALVRALEQGLTGLGGASRGARRVGLLVGGLALLVSLGVGARALSREEPEPRPAPPRVAAAADPRAAVEVALRRGQERLQAGDVAGALVECERALALDPACARAWCDRGRARARLGRRAEALADHERALELDPREAEGWLGRGELRALKGELPEALADLDRALELAPRSLDVWRVRARVHADLRQAEAGLADLDRALELAPDDPQVLADRAVMLIVLNRVEEALPVSERAIALDPRGARGYRARGYVRYRMGELEPALEDLGRAIALDPGAERNYSLRSSVRASLGRWGQALADLDQAIALQPEEASFYATRGVVHGHLNQPDEALADLNRSLELDPRRSNVRYSRGVALAKAGRLEEALVDLDRALEEPEQAWESDALQLRAEVRARLGR